ncbi:MAG: hypothetical protein GX607_16575 [Myxococcales bacterium]|jgi:hypothetical protein|nr:hypothetical protein [Myxococcales bacterium]
MATRWSGLVGLVAAVSLSCAGDRVEPDTPQGGRAAEAETREAAKPTDPSGATALTEVRDFRESIADRGTLLSRTAAPSVGQALVTVADGFYRDHQQRLHQAFDASLGELPNGAPPGPTNARLVGTVDAAIPEDADEQRQLAQFHLVFSPDIRELASSAFDAAFAPLASAQAEMPVSTAGELYGFFAIAEPTYERCGDSDVCIHYGDSDVFVVNFTRIDENLWTPAAVSWWTRMPPSVPQEGIGKKDGAPTPQGGGAVGAHGAAPPKAQPASAAGGPTRTP